MIVLYKSYSMITKLTLNVCRMRDSMILAFRVAPAAEGSGLCDIDRVLFRVAKSLHDENMPIISQIKTIYRVFPSCKDISIFRHMI